MQNKKAAFTRKILGKCSFFHGGDGGNRNRVRKLILMGFYERILSLGFPSRAADRKAARYGSRVFS